MTPSSWHGVTTVVMGNCGVGFAPAAADRHEWLIELMEGVEDIPGSAMTEGITWEWTSFPEYLDAVGATPKVLDVGAQIAHGPLRAFVMGERGAANEPATEADGLADGGARRGGPAGGRARLLHQPHAAAPLEGRRARARHRARRPTSCSPSATRSPAPGTACSSSRPTTPWSRCTSGRGWRRWRGSPAAR